VKRGEVWTAAGGPSYAGKPRPAVIVQDDRFTGSSSVTLCGLTSELTDSPSVRPRIEPTGENGLLEPSQVMVDKITTVPKTRLGRRIGKLAAPELARVDSALLAFLGLAG
jgi:mRNA interferase MazF